MKEFSLDSDHVTMVQPPFVSGECMLANKYIEVSDAASHREHVCTGWQGLNGDRRMLCTVAQASEALAEAGITQGVLALIVLDSWVEIRPDAPRKVLARRQKVKGRVKGVARDLLHIEWEGGDHERVSHHLVRFSDEQA